ncbi:unnamed protein product [Mytilus coruscus]|uniref:Uncharacterized protein n=1 Tax=Mytilus coruscus TaxID=42192 RepID=A0A6J8ELV2_MYTCO|nr:unnamed protein product [Mytilus coruscus]
MNDNRNENNTHREPEQHAITVSTEETRDNFNTYETVSYNWNSVEHLYESESIQNTRNQNNEMGSPRTEEIEMNIESENQNQYDYSEVNAQSMWNNINQTADNGVPNRAESKTLTYDVHVSDNIYNVTETSGNEPKDDVNNTYDHFSGEQTEDQYDIADNKVMAAIQCKTNEDLYS